MKFSWATMGIRVFSNSFCFCRRPWNKCKCHCSVFLTQPELVKCHCSIVKNKFLVMAKWFLSTGLQKKQYSIIDSCERELLEQPSSVTGVEARPLSRDDHAERKRIFPLYEMELSHPFVHCLCICSSDCSDFLYGEEPKALIGIGF